MDALAAEVRRWMKAGAGLAFAEVVAALHRTLTGHAARGDPLTLLRRLLAEERLSTEACLHLLAVARALQNIGALAPQLLAHAPWQDAFVRLRPLIAGLWPPQSR